MKSIKHALLGLLLATSAIAASATEISGMDFLLATDGPGTLQSWTFRIGGDSVMSNDTFNYDLLFNPPPSAPETYFAFRAYGSPQGAIAFTTASFSQFFGPTPDGYGLALSDKEFAGGGFIESTGLYDLHLEGTFLADGVSVVGRAVDDLDVVSVPEPVSVSLILAGLAGIAGTRRRRAKAAQQRAQAA